MYNNMCIREAPPIYDATIANLENGKTASEASAINQEFL